MKVWPVCGTSLVDQTTAKTVFALITSARTERELRTATITITIAIESRTATIATLLNFLRLNGSHPDIAAFGALGIAGLTGAKAVFSLLQSLLLIEGLDCL